MTSDPRVLITPEEQERRARECELWHHQNLRSHERFAGAFEVVLHRVLAETGRKTLPVQVRVKSLESFLDKCLRPSRSDPSYFRYADPRREIKDLVGSRITLYMLGDAQSIVAALHRYLVCEEQEVKGAGDARIPGYQGTHFSAGFTPERLALPEFAEFRGMQSEVQVRTVLQHTWAEIQHDLIYKPRVDVPVEIQRRLVGLAGILDVVDREFEDVTQDFEEYVATLGEEGVPGGSSASPTDVRDLVRETITINSLKAAGEEWYAVLEEIVDALGVDDHARLRQLLSQPAQRQKAVASVLTEEDATPNAVQVANGLLHWGLGDDYVLRHPMMADVDDDVRSRVLDDSRGLRRRFEAATGGVNG
jgi:ppGpp synthetase/RelA/SpoT-type nucleotidyltranferase